MAKRFITTEIFKDPWFMDLPGKYKLFWIFLLTDCSHCGVWQVNYKTASFHVGDHLEPVECERVLRDRIVNFDGAKYWLLPKFIEFQYGHTLNNSNKVHRSIIENLEKHNLLEYLPKIKIIKGALKGLPSPKQGVKDKDKDKDKDKEKEKDINKRIECFKAEVIRFKDYYSEELLNEFWEYWSEPNQSQTKMRYEMEKTWDTKRRLNTWKRNQKVFHPNNGESRNQHYNTDPLGAIK